MAGYNFSQGKSNNAVDAEESGRYTATECARLLSGAIKGISSAAIKELCCTKEWHHTSKWYNKTKYYDLEEVEEFFLSKEGAEQLKDFIENHNSIAEYRNCTVEWLEWSGTRKKPVCEERREEGCTVVLKKSTATITLPNGDVITKRIGTKGFYFYTEQEMIDRKKEEEKNAAVRAEKEKAAQENYKKWLSEEKIRLKTEIDTLKAIIGGRRIIFLYAFDKMNDKGEIYARGYKDFFTTKPAEVKDNAAMPISIDDVVEHFCCSEMDYRLRTIDRLKTDEWVRVGLYIYIKLL